MDELTIGDKVYISSKRAAKITGYAKDYVGQLCREGRVEARLVGRNWYVLEAAIREHRFGQSNEEKGAEKITQESVKTPVEPAAPIDSTWSAPSYRAEEAAMMPKLRPVQPQEPVSNDGGHAEQVVADMQAAWRDWFKSDQKSLPDGEELLQEEAIESALNSVPHGIASSASNQVTEEDVAVTISRLEEAQQGSGESLEEDEEVVPLHRNYIDQSQGEVVPTHDVIDLTAGRSVSESEEEGVIVRERKVKRKSVRKESTGSSVILRALLYAVALFAVVLGFIGSGYADVLLKGMSGYGLDKNVFIQYLDGTRTVQK